MKIYEDIDLSKLSYMKIGGIGQFLVEIEKDSEIKELDYFVKEKNKLNKIEFPVVFLGEGSNTIFSDEYHKKIFVKFKQNDIIKTYEGTDFVNLKVSAGLNWDSFVDWTVSNNLSGIECLSAIPGTVGASPIQNIGAYGQEVKNVIINVEVYEFETGKFYEITNPDCDFSYRNSIFKENIGKFAILNVGFRLSKNTPESPTYKDLSLYFLHQQKKNPTLKEIRDAVTEIRSEKLPNWETEPNCGSFFQNPIISNDLAEELIKVYPDIPQYNAGEGRTKISGGWLIEKVGIKGKEFDGIKIHDKSALVLINTGKGNFKSLEKTIKKITEAVSEEFGIELKAEPNLIK